MNKFATRLSKFVGLASCPGLLLAAVVGCGEGGTSQNLQAVSGKISYAGQAVGTGEIQFMPESAQGAPGRGVIQNGQYSVPKEAGLIPGKYKVLISSVEGEAAALNEEAPGDSSAVKPPEELIPAKYNVDSTLTAEIKEGENVLNFDLEK